MLEIQIHKFKFLNTESVTPQKKGIFVGAKLSEI